jgi:hypothetical protein
MVIALGMLEHNNAVGVDIRLHTFSMLQTLPPASAVLLLLLCPCIHQAQGVLPQPRG